MAIQYDLRKNHLVDGPDVHRAQVIRSRTIHFDNLVNEIADMGNTLTAVDIRGVIIALDHLIGNALAKGENVILPFCSFASSIRGNFNGRNDDFDPERHAVHPVIKAGVSLRKLYRNGIVLEKVRHAVLGREIDSFIDRNTGSVNSVVTPGGMGELIGYGLKFDQDDTAQGIFFVSEDNMGYLPFRRNWRPERITLRFVS